MFSIEATALSSVLLAIVASSGAGCTIARRYGRSPVIGAVLGGLIPIVGVGILVFLGRKAQRKGAVAQ